MTTTDVGPVSCGSCGVSYTHHKIAVDMVETLTNMLDHSYRSVAKTNPWIEIENVTGPSTMRCAHCEGEREFGMVYTDEVHNEGCVYRDAAVYVAENQEVTDG